MSGAIHARAVEFHDERFPGRAVFDTALSHAMLRRVGAGALPESLRLYRPDRVMLFSSLDARRPGFERAIDCASEAGFASAIRLAGGHAAAFIDESMAFAWALPDRDARLHIRPRFERISGLVVNALRALGLDARQGELAGEYCPGEFSVNLAGRVKVMGVGQRVIRGGAHVGGVLTVGETQELREALIPVYEALGLEFRPDSAGGIQDMDPSLGVDDVITALREAFEAEGARFETRRFDQETLVAADGLERMHAVDSHRAESDTGVEPGTSAEKFQALGAKTLVQTDRSARMDAESKD